MKSSRAADNFKPLHLVRRRVFVDPAAKDLEPLRSWPDLSAVLAVETVRSVTGTGKVEAEVRYVLTSCGDDPAVLVQAIRRHWGVENALHWVLDVIFREDDSRVRDRTAARNLALLRKIALNLVARDRGNQTKPADVVGAKWRPGTTITCSGSSLAKLMREPCWRSSFAAGIPRRSWCRAPASRCSATAHA